MPSEMPKVKYPNTALRKSCKANGIAIQTAAVIDRLIEMMFVLDMSGITKTIKNDNPMKLDTKNPRVVSIDSDKFRLSRLE